MAGSAGHTQHPLMVDEGKVNQGLRTAAFFVDALRPVSAVLLDAIAVAKPVSLPINELSQTRFAQVFHHFYFVGRL